MRKNKTARYATELGRVIKKKLAERKLTQKDLAERMGVSQATISSILSLKNTRYSTLERLADALDTSVAELISDCEYVPTRSLKNDYFYSYEYYSSNTQEERQTKRYVINGLWQ